MKWEGLTDVVLCGHSYGGFVISGVAEQMAPAIRSIVFLDAFVPRNGEAARPHRARRQEGVRTALQRGDIASRRGPRSLRRQRSRPRLGGSSVRRPADRDLHRQDRAHRRARRIAAKAIFAPRAMPIRDSTAPWRCAPIRPGAPYEVPCGHDVMVDMPERLTEILLEVAA